MSIEDQGSGRSTVVLNGLALTAASAAASLTWSRANSRRSRVRQAALGGSGACRPSGRVRAPVHPLAVDGHVGSARARDARAVFVRTSASRRAHRVRRVSTSSSAAVAISSSAIIAVGLSMFLINQASGTSTCPATPPIKTARPFGRTVIAAPTCAADAAGAGCRARRRRDRRQRRRPPRCRHPRFRSSRHCETEHQQRFVRWATARCGPPVGVNADPDVGEHGSVDPRAVSGVDHAGGRYCAHDVRRCAQVVPRSTPS